MDTRALIPKPQQMVTEADEIQMMIAEEAAKETQAFELKPARFSIVSTMQLFCNKLTSETYKTLEGIIIFSREVRGLWREGEKAPICSSTDGINGVPRGSDRSQRCASCQFNQWGSDPKSRRGKACKDMRRLIIQLEQIPIPVILSVPPTSVSAFDDYCSGLVMSKPQRYYFAVMTKLSLEKVSNPDGQDYSKVKFEKVRDLTIDELRYARALRDEFQRYVAIEVEAEDYGVSDTNGHASAEEPPYDDDIPLPEEPPAAVGGKPF